MERGPGSWTNVSKKIGVLPILFGAELPLLPLHYP